MTYTHSITSKGQITIPKQIRDELKLEGQASFVRNERGQYVLAKPEGPKSIKEIRALLGKPSGKDPLSEKEKVIGDMLAKQYDAD